MCTSPSTFSFVFYEKRCSQNLLKNKDQGFVFTGIIQKTCLNDNDQGFKLRLQLCSVYHNFRHSAHYIMRYKYRNHELFSTQYKSMQNEVDKNYNLNNSFHVNLKAIICLPLLFVTISESTTHI